MDKRAAAAAAARGACWEATRQPEGEKENKRLLGTFCRTEASWGIWSTKKNVLHFYSYLLSYIPFAIGFFYT